jgi:hypothetical protein
VRCYPAAARAAAIAVPAGGAAAQPEDGVMAARRGAVAEDLGAMLRDEHSEPHRAGGGKPLPPRRSGRLDVEVERDALVPGQSGPRRSGEHVVEPGGKLGFILGGEDRNQCGPSIACIGQITIIDSDRLRLLMCQQKRA